MSMMLSLFSKLFSMSARVVANMIGQPTHNYINQQRGVKAEKAVSEHPNELQTRQRWAGWSAY